MLSGSCWSRRSMYSASASSSSSTSVGVVGAVIAASIDAMSDSRDAGDSSPQHAMKPTSKSRRASGACICATGAHARSAGEGDSRRSSTHKWRIQSCQSSAEKGCCARVSHSRRIASCLTGSLVGCTRDAEIGRWWRAPSACRKLSSSECRPSSACGSSRSYSSRLYSSSESPLRAGSTLSPPPLLPTTVPLLPCLPLRTSSLALLPPTPWLTKPSSRPRA